MKTLLFALLLISSFTAHAALDKGEWERDPKLPSCTLYRHRLADHFQRLQEVNLALKIKKEMLTKAEVKNLLTLWERTDAPLFHKAEVKWSAVLPSEGKIFNSENVVWVKVESEVFEWDYDRFEFPEEIMVLSLNDQDQMKVDFSMPYMQSCLVVEGLKISFGLKNGEILNWEFDLKR